MGQNTVLCPWDYEIDSEDDEDWMFSSIKLYHHLYMFNINISPVSISMSPDNKCVALADKESGHLEVYRLPGKLVADTRTEEGLTSNRDFSLISGTVNCDNVTCVSYLDSNSLVTTQDNSQDISVWQWNDGDDLIEKKNSLCHCDFQPTGVHTNTEDQNSIIVYGEKIVGRAQSGLQMLDRREVVSECKDSVKIENVVSQGHVCWTFDTTCDTSHVTTIDWRTSQIGAREKLNIEPSLSNKRILGCFLKRNESPLLVTLSDNQLKVWDLRNILTPMKTNIIELSALETCQLSVGCDDIVVSDKNIVKVFSISDLNLKFEHKGHKSAVTKVFSSGVNSLNISADAKHGLHAWVYQSS